MNFKWENTQKSGIFKLNFAQKVSFDIGTIQASIWKPQTRCLRPIWGLKTRKCAKSDLIPYLLYIHPTGIELIKCFLNDSSAVKKYSIYIISSICIIDPLFYRKKNNAYFVQKQICVIRLTWLIFYQNLNIDNKNY